ncbi:MAG: hypothetical protein ACT6FC_07285 [Methanosarcinaceae archaeon]
MEGGILVYENDKVLLAQILLYKIENWGLAEFTPVTNPDVSTHYEMFNFTETDWDKLINPDPVRLQNGFDIVKKTLKTYDPNQTPNYLYWVSQDEVEAAIARGKDVDIQYNYYKAATHDNKYLMFLQAYEDFSLVINP